MKTRSLALLLALSACSQDRVLKEITETPIGASGGTVTSADGLVRLEIPAGAVADDVKITVTVDKSVLKPRLATALYAFGPEGLTFAKPVQATISVAGAREGRYAIANFDGADPVIVEGATFDASAQIAKGVLRHFSGYGALLLTDPCTGKACGDSCTVCDPADTTCVNPPGPHACDSAGACVAALPGSPLLCGAADAGPAPDALPPPIDAGSAPDFGATFIDAGSAPDFGATFIDAGIVLDSGVGPRDSTPFVPDSGLLPAIDEVEPNDTSSIAQGLSVPLDSQVTVRAAIDPAGDVDVFRVEVPSGVRVQLHAVTYAIAGDSTSCAQGLDTHLELIDGAGRVLVTNDDANMFCAAIGGVNGPTAPVLDPGTYYVRVRHFVANRTYPRYYLDVSFITAGVGPAVDAGPGPSPDAGVIPMPDAGTSTGTPIVSEMEPNDTLQTANPMANVVLIQGDLGVGDEDWFAFDVRFPSTLHAVTHSAPYDPSQCVGLDTVLSLVDANNAPLAQNDDGGAGMCSELGGALGNVVLQPGTYYLGVRHFVPNRAGGRYYLDVTLF